MQVLVATRDPEVLATVRKHPDAQEVPALDTGNVYKAIPDIQLAIIDYRDLFARPFSVDLIRRLLDESGVPQCSSSEFKQSPGSYLDRRYPKGRTLPLLEQRTIAFTSYAGGTGKTSLALDTAYRFVERTRNAWLELPAAVFELTYGGSALKALVGERQPTIDELVEQPEREPFRLHGFTLYPMEYGRLQQVDRERVIDYMRKQMGQHVLTILDTSWPHGFAQDLGADVDLWIVVATPRIDAVENAQHLREQLAREYGERRVITVLNQMGTFGDRLAVWGTSYQLEIQKTKQTGVLFKGRLGKEILGQVYNTLWQEYERARGPKESFFGFLKRSSATS